MSRQIKKGILVALDRDGTLIHDEDGYFGRKNNWKEDIKFYEGAAEAVKLLNNFARVVVTTNQIGVAKGFYGTDRVEEINKFIGDYFRKNGAVIDGWYFSPYVERKWAEQNGLDTNTPWVVDGFPETRKPKTGMLESAAKDLEKNLSSFKKIYVIGDSLDDINMALNASGSGILFLNDKNKNLTDSVKVLESANPGKVFYADSLVSAAKIIKLNNK
jgi:D-glycero-D-manno-heptose 1,7-bisphosphate phosphatase